MNKKIRFLTLLTVLLLPLSSFAFKITGKVSIKNNAGALEKEDLNSVVIYLVPAKDNKKNISTKKEPKILQKNKAFLPLVLPIVVGTTVEFENLDPYMHNVFSVSDTKSFNLGLYKLGDKGKKVKFDKTGIVSVYCNIHEEMRNFILVLDNSYFTMADQNGNYSLDLEGLPPGDYKLAAWYLMSEQKIENIHFNSEDKADINFNFTKFDSMDMEKLKLINH